jgi:glycosyltransferase involved in cell wall biosynthesis
MSLEPKVTVLIPVYNRGKYVAEAIKSVLAQSFTDFEVLLIDDGSTDNSVEVMRSHTDPRVRLVCNERNLGIPQTRNKGLALARGEYLAMLDSDDYAYPTRLAKQVNFLDRHRDYALIGTWTGGMDEKGRFLRRVRVWPVSPGEVQARLLFQCCPAQSSIMARTAILREYGYREQYAVSSDFDLWVRLVRRHKLGNLPTVLIRSRMHGDRITREKAQLVKDACLDIIRPQLEELRMTFSFTDLERHFLLLRMTKRRFTPDWEYVEWAETWLRKLREANQQTLNYPQESFSQLLGQIWFLVCWQAVSNLGWTAWRSFRQSPLSKEARSGVKRSFFLLAFKHALQES